MQSTDAQLHQFEHAMDRLRRIKLSARIHWLDDLGLSEAQMHAVLMLADGSQTTSGDIAKTLCVTSGAATQTIETLVRRGLVERHPDETDRRVIRLQLSPAGHELATSVQAQRHRYFVALMERLTPAETANIVSSLNLLADAINQNQNLTGSAPNANR